METRAPAGGQAEAATPAAATPSTVTTGMTEAVLWCYAVDIATGVVGAVGVTAVMCVISSTCRFGSGQDGGSSDKPTKGSSSVGHGSSGSGRSSSSSSSDGVANHMGGGGRGSWAEVVVREPIGRHPVRSRLLHSSTPFYPLPVPSLACSFSLPCSLSYPLTWFILVENAAFFFGGDVEFQRLNFYLPFFLLLFFNAVCILIFRCTGSAWAWSPRVSRP